MDYVYKQYQKNGDQHDISHRDINMEGDIIKQEGYQRYKH